jgi:hypothetical protein
MNSIKGDLVEIVTKNGDLIAFLHLAPLFSSIFSNIQNLALMY